MGWYDTTVGSLCAVYVKEKCLMSPIVSAKTVRILHAGTLAQAAKLYSDIQFIYVVSASSLSLEDNLLQVLFYQNI